MKRVTPGGLGRAWSPLIALVLVLSLVVAACGDDDESTGTTGAVTTAATTATTAAGGDVGYPDEQRFHTMTEPASWDPVGTCSWCGFSYGVYEYLVDYPPLSTELAPVLSTEVPSDTNGLISDDGLVYTFPIRQGVKFHDGTDLTAEDVKYTFDRAMALNLPDGTGSRLVDTIAETRVVDDYTFEVTLKAPAAYFLNSVVASFAAAIVSKDAVEANGGVVPNEPNEWMLTNEVGTGPYTLAQWDRNEQLYFEPFADYWGDVPDLPVRWIVVTDNAAATIALRAGDMDWIEPIPQLLEEVEGETDVCPYYEGSLIEPILAAYNLNIDPDLLPGEDTIPADFFHDPRVRQAFNYTFPYDTFINEVMRGMGAPASWIPEPIFGYNPDVQTYSQDLAMAEQLFRDAGWWDEGFTLSVLVESGDEQFYAVGLLLKDALAALNPKFVLNVIGVSGAVFDEAFVERPYPYAMWIKNQDPFRDPHFIFMDHWHPDGLWGTTMNYRNGYSEAEAERFVELIEQGGVETNLDTRYEMYTELQEMAFANPMWLWVAQEKNLQLPRCWLQNFSKNPLWPMPRPEHYTK